MNDLVLKDSISSILESLPEHKGMLEVIESNMPEIVRGTSFFGKTQSQFMDNFLTVNHPTPLRNLRQILAEINKAKEALREAHFKMQKKIIEMHIKQESLSEPMGSLQRQLVDVELAEFAASIESSKLHISGAVRKITALIKQYNAIKEAKGISDFNEEDFEKEEAKYHIMKAFEQGLIAARAHMGMIDEGNLIYLHQVGVNGRMAQNEITAYLTWENEQIKNGNIVTHLNEIQFLEQMALKFSGVTDDVLKIRGMQPLSQEALLLKGNTQS